MKIASALMLSPFSNIVSSDTKPLHNVTSYILMHSSGSLIFLFLYFSGPAMKEAKQGRGMKFKKSKIIFDCK